MFVLLIFYTLAGQLYQEEIPQPDYQTCAAERDLWLKHVNKAVFLDPEAHCVVRVKE